MLEQWYGTETATEVQQAEAFEICEYGRQPDEADIRRLFPMLGQTRSHIISKKTGESIKIDGQLSEIIYQKAAKVYLKNSMDKQVVDNPDYTTFVQVFHDEQNLYLTFVCHDLDIHSSYTKRDENLWKEEAVEVFIDTDQQPNDYVEIEVSPKNILYDSYITDPQNIDVPDTKKFDLSGIQTAVKVNGTTQNRNDKDQSWTVEMAIPFKELIENFHPDQLNTFSWRINFYRLNQDKSPLKYMAWSPTQGTFHQPDKFGTIIFR